MPFVFAAWIANKPIPQDFIEEFNQALKYGLDHRAELLKELPARKDFDFEDVCWATTNKKYAENTHAIIAIDRNILSIFFSSRYERIDAHILA